MKNYLSLQDGLSSSHLVGAVIRVIIVYFQRLSGNCFLLEVWTKTAYRISYRNPRGYYCETFECFVGFSATVFGLRALLCWTYDRSFLEYEEVGVGGSPNAAMCLCHDSKEHDNHVAVLFRFLDFSIRLITQTQSSMLRRVGSFVASRTV